MNLQILLFFSALDYGLSLAASALKINVSHGQESKIPSWYIQPSSKANANLSTLSQPGVDVSTWHFAALSKCTLMGCLIEAGLYQDSKLWYSNNLKAFDLKQFTVPWLYRQQFSLSSARGSHYFLKTNGISSRADIYFNGRQVATKKTQSGAYGGQVYDITEVVRSENAIVIQAYPANYKRDLVIGFGDWNPESPDNGTGVWRDVTIKQTGPVALSSLSVLTQSYPSIKNGSAQVALKINVQNLEKSAIAVDINIIISLDSTGFSQKIRKNLKLKPGAVELIKESLNLDKPAIWWPKQWGDQPLYTVQLSAAVDGLVSDSVQSHFGISQVTSQLNQYNDTQFFVNGRPFQVLGAGYAPDMFLRWDSVRFKAQAQYMLDMGLNTIRLEGKMEHPEFYDITDRLGLMVIPGWECCDKWEAWSYNDDIDKPVPIWNADDYATANASIRHEVAMIQNHPSALAFLIGSDYWPNKQAASIYVKALKDLDWQPPVIASAAKRGFPDILRPSGMKMDGPYDWVPPNYWYDTKPSAKRFGAAFGFGSELGAGVGTPELGSLKKFLAKDDMEDLWKSPNKTLYHMSKGETFSNRGLYNRALWNRYGAPTSLEDYLLKAQMMDFEATRAQFEAYSSMWNAERPATGLVYWMLNNAWPSLHWNLFDYYLHPAGSYFGVKTGSRIEHVAYDYIQGQVYLINHSLYEKGSRRIKVDVVGVDGKSIFSYALSADTIPNTSKNIFKLPQLFNQNGMIFLKLSLTNGEGVTLSRNVYWLSKTSDALKWDDSTWYHTPTTRYANFTGLDGLNLANLSVSIQKSTDKSHSGNDIMLQNQSPNPAVFVRLNLVDKDGNDIVPVKWSDNYVTLFPFEKLRLEVSTLGSNGAPAAIEISGKNVAKRKVAFT
ncbi:hypothetical protein O181_031194 [Austropuccinia psidii MF-1]|uniref:Exo-1,4-beta-D-glucosaminidase n=1 Tax=Austropuccinia psidii MF-1 TaxID=1389203 RepID=A0A9Q3CV89_9BASI|nr:hypothetical protein [Austropuccinia psidii MF-1]